MLRIQATAVDEALVRSEVTIASVLRPERRPTHTVQPFGRSWLERKPRQLRPTVDPNGDDAEADAPVDIEAVASRTEV